LQHGGHVDYHGITTGGQGSYKGSGGAGSRYHHTCIETDQPDLKGSYDVAKKNIIWCNEMCLCVLK
ncbi:hypothetical protein, partial [Flavonifractor plautii]|uniref:hypothetical protein n=1 Tax=Flavonifractor plautii TaxID=292800 RepID=UPI003D7EF315